MSKIFVGQSKLRFQATTGVDITSADPVLIKYKKPDGTTGSWTATIGTESTGIIYYDLTSVSDLDQAGLWTFWAHITFSDSLVAAGEIFTEQIYTEGTNT